MKMYVGYPKKKPTKIARTHGNFMKRTSELHESAINYKNALLYVFEKTIEKSLVSVEDLRQS